MTSVFIGGAAEAPAEAGRLRDWLLANGVDTVRLDSEALSAPSGLDDALKAVAACDAVILLASPLGRARLSFAPLASAAAFAGRPVLLVAWPGVDRRSALPSHVHATHYIEVPGDPLSAEAEAGLRAFLDAASPFSVEEPVESLTDESETAIPEVDDGLDPFGLPAGTPASAEVFSRTAGAGGADEAIDWSLDDIPSSYEAPETVADDKALAEPVRSAPAPRAAAPASVAPPVAPPDPVVTTAASASDSTPGARAAPDGLDVGAMLARAPGAVLPGAVVRRSIAPHGPGGAAVERPGRRGAFNAAAETRDRVVEGAPRDRIVEGAPRRSGSGALIATGVVLAAAAAAAYMLGPKIVEWLGLGAAIAVPAGGMAQPADGDRVEASVFAPPSVARGDVARVQVFLSTRDQRDAARATAQEQDPAATRRAGRPLSANLRRGAEVEVALMALDQAGRLAFDIDAGTECLVWDGEPVSVDFFIEAHQEAALRHHRLAAVLLRDGKPIGELRFTIETVKAADAETPAPALGAADTESELYRNLFFSYAREDIDAVRLVARSYRMLEQDFFWDVDDLEPGQSWEEELERRIDEADVFILFWSKAAQKSEWVRREVKMALAREALTGKPRFMPFPIEGPPPAEPWESIASRHIGDPLYFRAVQAARKKIEETREK